MGDKKRTSSAAGNEVIADSGHDLGVIRLTAFSIGLTLASGIFSMSGDMAANGANTAAVLIGWAICGVGMIALMMCFYNLNAVRPDLKSGIFSYAKEGFGDYVGFNSAWGYWISAMLANVSFATLLFAAIGYFFPIFGEGNNLSSIICVSLILWGMVYLVQRGVSQAATINLVVVIAKLLPILVLVVAILFARAFRADIFMDNFWGEGTIPLMDQIKATTSTTVWAFIGIEGAVVISGRAKKAKDAGRAVVISFLSLWGLYMIISVLSMGVMTRGQLAELGNPPMAGVLDYVVGSWGAVLVNFAVVVSLAGALFSYTMLVTESAYTPALENCFCKIFTKENKNKAPINALVISNLVIQVFLILLLFNESTYQIFYTLSASMIMFPYLLSAAFYLKIVAKGDAVAGMSGVQKMWAWVFAIVGTIYGLWLLYASGMTYVLITSILYAPGTLVYLWAKKEKGEKPFKRPIEWVILAVILVSFVVAAVMIANGTISPF